MNSDINFIFDMTMLSLINSFFLKLANLDIATIGLLLKNLHSTSLNILDEQKNEINKKDFFLGVKKWANKILSMISYQSAHCAQQPPISRCLRYLVRTKRCDCCLQCLNSVIKWVSNWEVKFYNIFTRKNICYCFLKNMENNAPKSTKFVRKNSCIIDAWNTSYKVAFLPKHSKSFLITNIFHNIFQK